MDLASYFLDPVLRGPMIGTLFLCLTLSLAGVFVFFQKKSLLGEVLSHAAYPGVILGFIVLNCSEMKEEVLLFAFLSCCAALYLIKILTQKTSQDLSLTFILSSFFGLGILLLSLLQFSCGYLGRLAESFFFGQAATMGDREILHYGLLALLICLFILFSYRELKTILFDPVFAKSIGLKHALFSCILTGMTLVALVAGMRSVGVVLISAMLVAPVIAAKQFTSHFSTLLILSAFFGLLSAFFGNILSFELSRSNSMEGMRLVIPTGPTIVLIASLFSLLAIFFSPKKGVVSIALRLKKFREKIVKENLLKTLYRNPKATQEELLLSYPKKALNSLKKEGYITAPSILTDKGIARAKEIIRLHRLWEVYLVQMMGKREKDVHEDAEEMEHILTPEMEEELTKLLNDPKVDPHQQPIPPKMSP